MDIGVNDSSLAEIVIYTTNVATSGEYRFRYAIADLATSTFQNYDFTISISDNPCVGSWTNIPADYELDASVVQFDGTLLTIPFQGMNYGQCEFEVAVGLMINGL